MQLTPSQIRAVEAVLAVAKRAKEVSLRSARKAPIRDALLALLKNGPMSRKELAVHFPKHSLHDLSMALGYARERGYIRKVPPMRWGLPEAAPAPKPVGRPRSTAFVGQVKNAQGEWVSL